jgi:hypothetical protein
VKKDLGIPDFPSQIERIVETANLSYMDAVIHWCEKKGLEYEVGGDLVKRHASIRTKVREEAKLLNCVK